MPQSQLWKRKPKMNVAITKVLQCIVTDKKITGRAKKVQRVSETYKACLRRRGTGNQWGLSKPTEL